MKNQRFSEQPISFPPPGSNISTFCTEKLQLSPVRQMQNEFIRHLSTDFICRVSILIACLNREWKSHTIHCDVLQRCTNSNLVWFVNNALTALLSAREDDRESGGWSDSYALGSINKHQRIKVKHSSLRFGYIRFSFLLTFITKIVIDSNAPNPDRPPVQKLYDIRTEFSSFYATNALTPCADFECYLESSSPQHRTSTRKNDRFIPK